MNRKSKFLSITFGLLTFVITAVLTIYMGVELEVPFSRLKTIAVEPLILSLIAAGIGYVWGVVFPPKQV
ncbi:MAG: hypothetical protein AAFN77_24595 [Planctomycetota bacterium]